jgi:tetratricopeptide (TPR) repeat protein
MCVAVLRLASGEHEQVVADLERTLGYAHHGLADYRRAIACYTRAATLFRDVGEPLYEASSLTSLSNSYQAVGDLGLARRARQRAQRILDALDLTMDQIPGQPHVDPTAA